MESLEVKYLIVGAGLSGLTTANMLYQAGETNFLVLEARDRVGGRIFTKGGIDLGATWFQEQHTYTHDLLKKLNLKAFNQYSNGKSVLVYNSMAPAHFFESDPRAPVANRVSGGTSALIHALSDAFADKIKLETPAFDISEKGNIVEVATKNRHYRAQKVMLCMPPKLAQKLDFSPDLPSYLKEAMQETHTWMSNAIKVGITYDKAFWRKNNLSGTVIGQIGPVIELYDHANATGDEHSLMGFVNEALRDESAAKRKDRILTYLEQYLGPEIRNYNSYLEKDWSKEKYTSGEKLKSVYMSPQYGNPVFEEAYFNDKIYFSGSETSPHYGGYLEGAIYSGMRIANKILSTE